MIGQGVDVIDPRRGGISHVGILVVLKLGH